MSSNNDMFSGIDLFTGYGQEVAQSRRTNQSQFRAPTVERDSDEANNTLSFQDMLLLMVTQLQNQTIDNQADTSDMMNQLVQMTSMQAMNDMVSQMKDLTTANILSYSSSLVGKTVTVGVYNEDTGKLEEIVGEVEAAGTYDGQQVIYIKGKAYYLSQIMAVGTLPKPETPPVEDGEDGGEDTGNTEEDTENGTEGV